MLKNLLRSIHPLGLVQPLPTPTRVWPNISIDFLEGLFHKFSVVLVVGDRLSKYAHIILVTNPYKASKIAQGSIANIFK